MTHRQTLASELGLVPAGVRTSLRTGPWSPDHGIAVCAANLLAIVLCFVAWWQTSGIATARAQLGWFDASLLGVVIGIGANAWFIARGRRMIRLGQVVALAGVAGPFGYSNGGELSTNGSHPVKHKEIVPAGRYVAGERMSRYHIASCLLAADKQVTENSRAVHERAGRRPCELCQP